MDELYEKQDREIREIFKKSLQAMSPYELVEEQIQVKEGDQRVVTICGQSNELTPNQNIWVFGTGKAAPQMASALEHKLGDRIKDGIVICPYGTRTKTRYIQQFEASHPLPDHDSESATYELLNLARKVPPGDLVIYALTGGTSALLCLPADDLELDELRKTYELLLKSGADIHEFNTVRKHLSKVKGGQLLYYLKDVRLVDLVISDVVDDDLESIGSGPTTPDSTTFEDAFQVLKRYRIWEDVPHAVRKHLAKGMHAEIPDTPKPGSDFLVQHKTHIIGSAQKLAERTAGQAKKMGYNVWVDDSPYSGDVRKTSKRLSEKAISVLKENDPAEKPAALIFYGESTVQVKGNGKGGRNQELALAAALSIEGQHHITLLSAGTDGRDGPTDAAGAVINAETALKARKDNIEPEDYLQNNDSYHFFEKINSLLKTGPTGNNLMDLQIILIDKS